MHDTFWSNNSPKIYKKCESGVSIIHMFMVFQCTYSFKKSRYHLTLTHTPYYMLYSLLQIHELNARNMYKDDKYCHPITA
jgi:hypothetical protein